MDPNNPFPIDFGAYAGLGIVFFIIWLVFTVVIIIVSIWIQYTIIWKAVRRGMREFYHVGKNASPQVAPPAPPVQ